MYEQFQNLRDPEKQMELRVFIQGLTEEELVKILHTSVCKTDAPKIFDDILQAFPDSEVYQSKRRKLIESTLHILGKTKIPTVLADAIINRIIFDLPKHSKHNIVKLVDACAVDIRDHDNKHNELLCWKDLLPALLEALENEKRVVHMDTEVTGNEYKSLIVKAICNYRWNINHLPLLAKMFGDMGLDKQDRRIVIGALCRALPDLSPNQVPPFVYQALKLCKDRDNHYFFDTLCKYFESSYAKAISMDDKDSMESIGIVGLKELVDIESTVLYYVYQAVQLNHESLKDFIRYLKSTCQVSEYILQPFMLAVLMSVSGIYTDQIFEILKLTIVNDSLEKEKRQTSAWLRQLLPSELNLIGIVRRIIDTSNKDRHMVLKGLMELAFVLMSTSQKLKHNTSVLWNTGAEIIQEIIKKRHETVATVLQELIDKIVVGGTPMIHYTDCLKYVCRELSVIVLDHQIWIMTLLERLLFLPIVVADQVLFAILPLMNVSPNIRENLLLTLRKGLYRKGIAKRQMAVTGFLEMLKYSKMHSLSNFRLSQRCNSSVHTVSSSSTSTLTQVVVEHCTQREKSSNEADKTLCYEILDILKKSFTYEFEVRLHLYKGFYGTVARNPEITEVVLNMLVSHLNLYLEKDDILPPVKFELCIDVQETEVVLKEPIAELIFVIQKIYHRMFSRTSNISDEWHDILELLCTRMAATNLEHLNLEREIDFSEDSVKFKIKLSNLNMAITIYEALIAFRIGQWFSKESSAICDSIENLFEGYTRSIDLIKMQQSIKTKKADGGKAKKNKNTSHTTRKSVKSLHVKIPTTIMDLDAIHQCLSLLYSNRRSSSTQCQIVKLCENRNFCCYILQTCEQLLQRSNSLFTDTCQQQSNLYIDVYIDIGGILYEHFFINLVNVTQYDEQIIILALQCFNEICRSMCTTFSSELPRFLNRILRSKHNSASMDINLQLQEVIFSLNDHFVESFSQGTDSNVKKKVPSLLLQIMERLAYKINFAECNGEKVFKCIKKLVQTNELEDTIVATIVQILLRLEEYTQEYGETLNEICLKLCEKVGTIDGNQLTSDKEYAIFREETFEPIYTTLNDCIKEKLSNASWLLSRLKAEDAIVRASGTIDEISNNNLREKERSLCKQLSYVTQILYTLVNTSIEPGPCTDITFKNLQCLYHLLGNLTKYFYTKSNGQNAAFQTVKFIQVIQLAGKPLKSAFYNLVTYLEENQNKVNAKVDSQARRNKILRETKVIPRVVYEIEQFNKEVLLLGKRTGIPLENHMKHSITRDFRIKNPQLVEGLEKMDTSLLSMSNSEDTESQNCNSNMDEMSASTADNATPSNKRSRSEEIEAYSSS